MFFLFITFATTFQKKNMRLLILFLPIFLLPLTMNLPTTREEQMNFTRVRQAYADKEKTVIKALASKSISRDHLRIYLRAFKLEKKIELWARNVSDSAFVLVKEFPICELSGTLGPKRRYRDLQVPEGYYHISGLNPYSKYYLSMEINYPNASDSIRGVKGHLGNQIFIHGACLTSGCIPITDDKIKELYVYCVEAYNSGQQEIALTIFPAQLNDARYPGLISRYSRDKDKISLWSDLKQGYDVFNLTRKQPEVRFRADGSHEVLEKEP